MTRRFTGLTVIGMSERDPSGILAEFAEVLTGTSDTGSLLNEAVACIDRVFSPAGTAIVLFDDSGAVIRSMTSGIGADYVLKADWIGIKGLKAGEFNEGGGIARPLTVAGRTIGFVWTAISPESEEDAWKRSAFALIAPQLGVAVNNALVTAELERLAVTDGRTGLYNEKYLRRQVRREIRRSLRYNQVFSLLFIEVEFGDEMGLAEAAGILKGLMRETDWLAIDGTERFVAVLTSTDGEGAGHAAGRLLSSLSSADPGFAGASAGIATFPYAGMDMDAIFGAARQALESAKTSGRYSWVLHSKEA